MRTQSFAVACAFGLSLLAHARFAGAEGSAELGTVQGLSSSTDLSLEILDPANEDIFWTGPADMLVLTIQAPSGALVVVPNGGSAPATEAGVHRVTLLRDLAPGEQWDIAVRTRDTDEERIGRLFALQWVLQVADATAAGGLSTSFYAKVPGGGESGVVQLLFDGLSSNDAGSQSYVIKANGVGLSDPGRSMPGTGGPAGELALYLEPPASASYSLPAPQATGLVFRGGVQACDVLVPGQPGGRFLFTSSAGRYHVMCDLDGDGIDVSDDDDLLLVGAAQAGPNVVPWDGTDRDGNPIAPGEYQCQVRVTVGELHFLAEDIETLFPGVRMFGVDAAGAQASLAMYWNDTPVQGNDVPMPNGEPSREASGAAGMSSGDPLDAAQPNVNARAWGDFGPAGKGNDARLDTFTWLADDATNTVVVTALAQSTDSDGDGIDDVTEFCNLGTDPNDTDSDDDGLDDGEEADADTDGDGLSNAIDPDSDNDGIFDGTESGVVTPGPGTDTGRGHFVPDADPTETTNPLDRDTDTPTGETGFDDGSEDENHNGRVDPGEFDPNERADDLFDLSNGGPAIPPPDGDADGLTDDEEDFSGTDPGDADGDDDGLLDGAEPNWNSDTDRDGILNVFDTDSDNDGLFDGTEAGVADASDHTDTGADAFVPDADPDTTTFVLVADSDRGGVRDGAEDPNHDGRVDAGELDPNNGADDLTPPLDTDGDGLTDAEEGFAGIDPNDADTDDDGVQDGAEVHWNQDSEGDGLLNAADPDSDNDALYDGTESGVATAGPDTDTNAAHFIVDADPATRTDPLDPDTDDGTVRDGAEDGNHDGRVDAGETDPNDPADDVALVDTDSDGLLDVEETMFGSDYLDADSDEDGVIDGAEPNWNTDTDGDTFINARDADSDDDGLFDATELGLTAPHAETDLGAGLFVPDADPSTTTSALNPDTDRGSVSDGAEDFSHNGRFDLGETDPNDPADDVPEDSDGDGLGDGEEVSEGTEPDDADTDDDGVSDGDEPNWNQDRDGDELINARDPDSDGDGLNDGIERGLTAGGPGTDVAAGNFTADADPATTTNMLIADTDDGGVVDGLEDADHDGRVDDREIDPNDPADDMYLDQDQDTIIDTDEGAPAGGDGDDADGDGTPNWLDLDADGDTISDEHEAGDADRMTAPADTADTDGDNTPDFLDTDTDNDSVSDADEAGDADLATPPVDTDGDSMPDFRDTDSDDDELLDGPDPCRTDPTNACVTMDDRDGDGIPDDTDNCPDAPNPGQLDSDGDGMGNLCDTDADGDGWDDDLTVAGGCGGCAAGDEGGTGSALLVLLALGLAMRRRRAGLTALGSLAVLVAAAALALPAHAQPAPPPADVDQFTIERFRLASDSEGVLHTEWGAVPAHLSWDVGLVFGMQDDPLVIYREMDGGDRERVGALVARRISSSLVGSVALWNRLALSMELPVILSQSEDAPGGAMAMVPELTSTGIGDVRITPKVQILDAARSGLHLSLLASLFLPTASGEDSDYWGEERVAFAPEAALARAMGPWRFAANVGYLARKNARLLDLSVTNELYLRLGTGYRMAERGGLPLEFDLGLSAATAAARPLTDYNTNHFELLAGAGYDLPGPFSAALGAGLGLSAGFGTPDWRVLLAVRASGTPELDGDKDGLLDDEDTCPAEAEDKDAFQDEDGCPDPDNDGDGVLDAADGAPNEPEDKDDFEDQDGVPDLDNDQDGLRDAEEACPNEPETKNDYQDEDGCPDELPDSDSDGLIDRVDECPDQAEDMDSFEDEDGCPDPDNDGDGLADDTDRCVSEAGPAENRGCPDTDRDGDGVVDRLDNCPDEPGTAANQGCKRRQRVRISSSRLEILDRVFFQNNRAKIQRRSFALLRNVAQVLMVHPEIEHVRIEGHTDDRGNDDHNLKLSQQRAEAVVEFLVKEGVPRERLTPVGFGEIRPIDSNKTNRGRGANRRVEFNIVENAEAAREGAPAAATPEAATPEAGSPTPLPLPGPTGDTPAPGTPAPDAAAPLPLPGPAGDVPAAEAGTPPTPGAPPAPGPDDKRTPSPDQTGAPPKQ
jgi:MYXO-CTERM domain-containing protein